MPASFVPFDIGMRMNPTQIAFNAANDSWPKWSR